MCAFSRCGEYGADVLFFLLQLIRAAGGRFALSDDSHGPHAVGLNYGRLFEYARRVGVDSLSVLAESESPNAAGRCVGARAVPGRWWEHPFWSNLAALQKQT